MKREGNGIFNKTPERTGNARQNKQKDHTTYLTQPQYAVPQLQ